MFNNELVHCGVRVWYTNRWIYYSNETKTIPLLNMVLFQQMKQLLLLKKDKKVNITVMYVLILKFLVQQIKTKLFKVFLWKS